MSAKASKAKNLGARAGQAGALAVVFGLLFFTTRLTPGYHGTFGIIAAIGFLLLAGMLLSELLELVGLPHLTAYIVAGVVAGPHVLNLVDQEAVQEVQPVNTLALALIAFAGGAELRFDLLRRVLKSLFYAQTIQSIATVAVTGGAFILVARALPFTSGLDTRALLGVGLLWGMIAAGRSPAAALGILAQLKPDGPLTRFSLAFVMSSDVVVVVLLSLSISAARLLVDPGAGLSMHDLQALGHEILGSISLGTSLGLLLAIYLKLVGGQLLLVLIALGFGLTEGLRYLRFDPLLAFLVAGFVVSNLSKQGHKLLVAVEETGSIVFVVFFATAGASLDIPLLRSMWPFALLLSAVRAGTTWIANLAASTLAREAPIIRRWGWSSLVSQAGLTLGLVVAVERSFPSFGAGFRSLAVATVAVSQLIGPVVFKVALDRTGETGQAIEKRLSNPDAIPAFPSQHA